MKKYLILLAFVILGVNINAQPSNNIYVKEEVGNFLTYSDKMYRNSIDLKDANNMDKYNLIFSPTTTEIADFAFYNTISGIPYLDKIVGITATSVETIGDWAFYKNQIAFLSLPNAETIWANAFSKNKITFLSLPNVINIYASAFSYNKITELSLPNAVNIGDDAFRYNQITTISLPNVKTIGDLAFYKNTSLTKIILGENVPEIGSDVFDGIDLKQVVLYVPAIAIADYKADFNWNLLLKVGMKIEAIK
jgi:hypothetical protein